MPQSCAPRSLAPRAAPRIPRLTAAHARPRGLQRVIGISPRRHGKAANRRLPRAHLALPAGSPVGFGPCAEAAGNSISSPTDVRAGAGDSPPCTARDVGKVELLRPWSITTACLLTTSSPSFPAEAIPRQKA